VQTSDLFVHNPADEAMELSFELRRRGAAEAKPPFARRTVAAHATLYLADAVAALFARDNESGFLTITAEHAASEPVIASFANTQRRDGSKVRQTVRGLTAPPPGASQAAASSSQQLAGLADTSDQQASLGLVNPSSSTATARLRFFDSEGNPLRPSADLALPPWSQRQLERKELARTFGTAGERDYRIEIETLAGGRIVPYATSSRLPAGDPAFVEGGKQQAAKLYLIGVAAKPNAGGSGWRTDLLLANGGDQTTTSEVSFAAPGVRTTTPLRVTLAAGESERLENLLARWSITAAVGVVTVTSTGTGEVLPVAQGETYQTRGAKRFGQTITAMSADDAAGAGQRHYLVGLRQDGDSRVNFWLFNPGDVAGEYEVRYRRLDVSPLGTVPTLRLEAGALRQFAPADHPAGAALGEGFTVEVLVRAGKVLTAAQVTASANEDPTYLRGQVR